MGRANRGKIKERLTGERVANRSLRERLNGVGDNVKTLKLKQTMFFVFTLLMDYLLTYNMSNSVNVMATLALVAGLSSIWIAKYKED